LNVNFKLEGNEEESFIVRRPVSFKRESTIIVFTVWEEGVLYYDQEKKMTLTGKKFELRGKEFNASSGTEK
jgi:hypothetical protein